MPAPDLSSFKVSLTETTSATKFNNLVQAVQDEFGDIDADQIPGYPNDANKLLRSDGTWPIAPYVLLGDIDLTLTTSFSLIPSGFRMLRLHVIARGDAAATTKSIFGVRFNSDTGNNYDHNVLKGTNATDPSVGVHSIQTIGASSIKIGGIPCASATANTFSAFEVLIPGYTSGFHKVLSSHAHMVNVTGGRWSWETGGVWLNTAAITDIAFVIAAGGAFVSPSRAQLIGVG